MQELEPIEYEWARVHVVQEYAVAVAFLGPGWSG